MFGFIKQIKQDIEEIKHKQERIIWLMNETMKYGKKMSSHNSAVVVRKNQLVERNIHYYKRVLPILNTRFKRLDQIAKALKITEASATTYIKLARKAGYEIETKATKGQKPSYRLKKGN